MDTRVKAIVFALLAAGLYGISSPVSKILLKELSPTLMAALLYLGAGLGMLIVNLINMRQKKEQTEARITKKELPFVIGMILLDIAAPIFLMIGLSSTTSSNAALLNNFEIVATSIIAMVIFRENIGKRMWVAIAFITVASILISVNTTETLSFSIGSIFVLMACVTWGFENNCTRMLSIKNPLQIVVIKGFGSGMGSLLIFLFLREYHFQIFYVIGALMLGFVAYGLSIYLYIQAQRDLGAARTSAYYAVAPFIGVLVSWIVLREPITTNFMVGLLIMIAGTYFAITEDHHHAHVHDATLHEHKHNHEDGHHTHHHDEPIKGEHSHEHKQIGRAHV